MKTLTQLLAIFAVTERQGALALTAFYEDGTVASVITALGLSGQKAAAEAMQIVTNAHVEFAHILEKEFA